MSVYTPEPWIAFGTSAVKEDLVSKADLNEAVITVIVLTDDAYGTEVEQCANIQRIVDCVNACKGIPQAYLRELAEEGQTLMDSGDILFVAVEAHEKGEEVE